MNYIDPTGHFKRKAIWDYLLEYYEGDRKAARDALQAWQDDEDWWNMITAAEDGSILVADTTFGAMTFEFAGEGGSRLDGISAREGGYAGSYPITMDDIQVGSKTDASGRAMQIRWLGLVNFDGNHMPIISWRPGVTYTQTVFDDTIRDLINFTYGFTTGVEIFLLTGPLGKAAWIPYARSAASTGIGIFAYSSTKLDDALNIEPDDQIGCWDQTCLVFQPGKTTLTDPGGGYYIEEK